MSETIEEYLSYDPYESKHYIPNEIFEELQDNITKAPHIAFAYSYYYLVSWLYRYTKYVDVDINTSDIKRLLGYSESNKTMNYIIKQNGVLDSMGYTNTTGNYPYAWYLDENNDPEFMLIDDIGKGLIGDNKNRNYKIKLPVKHFHRYNEDYVGGMLTGVFYDRDKTHCVPFEVFMYCMSKKELGVVGFYLYSYIHSRSWKGKVELSYSYLNMAIGLPTRTLSRMIKSLKEYNMLDYTFGQDYYVAGLPEDERKPNKYKTNNWYDFNDIKGDAKKIPVKPYEVYIEEKKRQRRDEQGLAFGNRGGN